MKFHQIETTPVAEERGLVVMKGLEKYGAQIERHDLFEISGRAYLAKFPSGEAVTTVRILLEDQSGADVVLTNMTTLPTSETGKGFGSKAIASIVAWARENNLNTIRGVQVQSESEKFFTKNGFVKCPPPNPTNDFEYKLDV